ncbi:MAG: hypothetical protein M1281_14255 [Chloroflexi bacterium]|nr:hypothetical protein [Chloroflexota bacterium]
MASLLIVGYGNPDRQDDGAAWHILNAIASRSGQAVEVDPASLPAPSSVPFGLLFVLQLTPELAETLTAYDHVCFVDAHTGDIAEDLHIAELPVDYQRTPFTHHMTPQTCLFLAQTLYGHAPAAQLVSVRGYEFGFSSGLSERTSLLTSQAVEAILRLQDALA